MSRRPHALMTWLTYGLTALFLLMPLLPALIGLGTMIDVGALSAYLPFRADVGNASNTAVVCRGDTFDYYMPGMAEIKRSVLGGNLPTWAPYEVGGAPLASLPNHGALSPMSLPYWILPLWLAPAYVKLLEFVVAILGMVLFLRRLGVSTEAGLLAGVVFASSGFMIMWTNWPHTRVAALIPLLFWAIERVIQEIRALDVVWLGAIVASMLLGGFPAIVLFSHTAAAAYVLIRVLTRCGWRRAALSPILASAGGVLLGIGLSAVQIIPFAANLRAFDFASRSELGHHLPLYTAFTLADPYALGTCVGGEIYGRANPVEAIGFLGGASLILAAAAFVLRRSAATETVPTKFFTISVVLLGSAIWLGGPVLMLLQKLPLWSTNFVGRAQSVFGFLTAVLVGVAFDRLLRRPPAIPSTGERPQSWHENFRWLRLAVLAAGFVAVGLAVAIAMLEVARREDFGLHVLSTIPWPLMSMLAAGAAVVLAARGSTAVKTIALAGLSVLVVVPGALFARNLLPTSRVEDFYPVTSSHAYLNDHLGAERYAAQGTTMLAPTSDYYELRTPVGHEFTDQRWKDLLQAADPAVQRSVTYSMFSERLPIDDVTHSPVLDQLGVRYWVMSPRTVVGLREKMPNDSRGSVPLGNGLPGHCSLPGGALRGVRVQVDEAMPKPVSGSRPMLRVAVASGGIEREGSIMIDSAFGPGRLFVAVAGEDLPASSTADVRLWLTGVDGTRKFRGQRDQLDCAAVRPQDDGLRLVHSDAGGAIYERRDAIPRIRWAARSRVVIDSEERVRELKEGIPDDTVLLENTRLAPGQGKPADIDVIADQRGHMSTRVRAEGNGFLVIADSIVRPGWRAFVDGSPVVIEHGNHAFAAIPVPAGVHTVTLDYVAPGLQLGIVVTTVSLTLAAVPVIGPTLARRRLRRRQRSGPGGLP